MTQNPKTIPFYESLSHADRKTVQYYLKMGLEPVYDIKKVSLFHKTQFSPACIPNAIVFKVPGPNKSMGYLIIGNIVSDAESLLKQKKLMQQFENIYKEKMASEGTDETDATTTQNKTGDEAQQNLKDVTFTEEELDDLDEEKVLSVMKSLPHETKENCIEALKRCDGDIVNAILELSP